MLKSIRHSIAIKKLQRKARSNRDDWRAAMRIAWKEKNTKEQIAAIEREYQFCSQEFDDEISDFQSQYLIDLANSYFVPVPVIDHDEVNWERSHLSATWRLNDQGMAALRTAIRTEEKERFEQWSRWVTFSATIATVATGLVGTLIGLVSVLKS